MPGRHVVHTARTAINQNGTVPLKAGLGFDLVARANFTSANNARRSPAASLGNGVRTVSRLYVVTLFKFVFLLLSLRAGSVWNITGFCILKSA